MTVRVRDRVGRDTEPTAQSPRLAAMLCMPKNNPEFESQARELIDLTLLGMRWMALVNFVSIGLIAYLIMSGDRVGASSATRTLLACGLIIIACDILAHLAPMMRGRLRFSLSASVAVLSGLNLMSAGAWAWGLTASSSNSWQISVIAAGALAFGKLATMAMPTAFAARISVATAIYLASGFDPAAAAATLLVTLLSMGLVMSLVRSRWRMLSEKMEIGRAHV